MATTPIKYRISSVAPKPTADAVKGAPLTSLEIDGNFRSIKESIESESSRIDDIILNGIGSILARHSATATASQTVFDLPFTYSPGANNLVVFVNGILVESGADYTETSGTRVTFNSGLEAGQEVTFLTNVSPAPAAPLYSVAGITSYTLTSDGVLTSFALPVAVLNKDNTQVFVNGIYQEKASYSIAGSNLVFGEAPAAGKVEVVVQSSLAIGENLATQVSYTPAGTGAVATTVQSKLQALEISATDFSTLQQAIDELKPGQRLNISGDYILSSGLTITNKSRIRITGKGRIALSGASSSAYIFQLVGTIDDLEIDSLTLVGENNSSYSQVAIGNNSGQTISNVRFHDLSIQKINVGISLNADTGGSYSKGKVYNNDLNDILGTVAGSGYGIHVSNASDCEIYGNTITNASRHSLYQAKGANCNNAFIGNIIRNHRSTVANASYKAAISCSRSSCVTIANNKFIDFYDGGIEIAHDTLRGFDCSNILVIGNSFTNRRNVVPAIIVGEQLVPTSNSTYKVDVISNVFDENISLSGGSTIVILNGQQITVKNNRFRKFNVATSLPNCVDLGNDTYVTADSHITDITVINNDATSDVAVAGSQFAYVSSRLCVGQSTYKLKDNTLNGFASEFYFAATPVNLNSKLKFRTTVTHDFSSIPANSGEYVPKSVVGVKPTSRVTGNCQSWNISGGKNMVFTFYPTDNGPNNVMIQINNVTTSAYDPPNQSFILNIEDV